MDLAGWGQHRVSDGGGKLPTTDDPLAKRLYARLAPLSDLGEAGTKYQDNNKLGNLVVGVFANAHDAHAGLAALDEFSRAYGRRTVDVTKDAAVAGLGDEATVLWLGGRTGPQVTYHWRRKNLVLEVHVHCFGSCPAGIDRAARSWVDAVDSALHA